MPPGRVPAISKEPPLADEDAPHTDSRPPARAGEYPPTALARSLAAPGRPLVQPALDGVVVDLDPSRRRRRCVRRPLPSDAGSSPKDTQLSEQIRASNHFYMDDTLTCI